MSASAGLVGLAAVLLAQTAPSLEVRDVSGERPPTVNVVVRVTDDQGQPVAGLDAGSFDLFENGREVPEVAVRQSHPDELPIAVSILLDTSGSMSPEDLEGAKAGARSVLAKLTPEDLSEVVSFDSDVRVVDPFGSVDPEALDRLERLRGGNTRLNDALSGAIDRINAIDASERVIILLTDGLDEGSLAPGDALVRKVEGAGVAVHTIALGDRFDPAFVRTLADVSGASFRQTAVPAELEALYAEIASSLLTEYRISYETSLPPGPHELTVVARTPAGTASSVIDLQVGPAAPVNDDDEEGGSSALPVVLAGTLGALALLGVIAAIVLARRSKDGTVPAPPVAAAPLPPHASASLTSYHLLGPGGAFPIPGTAVLGRDPSATIVVDHETVSRMHARLTEQAGGVLIEDLGSSNGTTVNGTRVAQHVARGGDQVAFGDVHLELREPAR